jgi:phosphatidylserine decarboxylase
MSVAKEGFRFILPSFALALFFLFFHLWPISGLFLFLGFCFLFFFRDPKRLVPEGEGLLVAPADGRVVKLELSGSHPDLPGPARVISIFLSLFDVHVTRSPLSGVVEKSEYRPGRFFPAYRDEASAQNESRTLRIKGTPGVIVLKQIVGVAARRIKSLVREKDKIERGQKIGLMYFGSRVDLYLPQEAELRVRLNDRVKAGSTVIAEVRR